MPEYARNENEDLNPDLLEMGTRWEHYVELRDLFAAGAEVLKGLKTRSNLDDVKTHKLLGAVEMIETRLNVLSNYEYGTRYGSTLRKTIDGEVESMFDHLKAQARIYDQANENGEGSEAHPST